MTDQTTTPDSIIPPEVRTPEAYRAWRAERDAQIEEEVAQVLATALHDPSRPDLYANIARAILALLATAPTVEQVRQDVGKALRAQRIVCPVHGIPDCSALLNGCTRPNLIRKTVEGCAQIAEQGASDG
ncbi:hypothetical protein LQF12_02305 [Ruania suaedae]|uniref:hypothetical protein n=1 Tax=Ruania suaedae TaxID=2897774 RepID=UPI001E2C339A|nr:hypothetical protein [Ruania suaedae]UFU03465.1 hypothetical protein LQF12_02305 [Ruania suaedae]